MLTLQTGMQVIHLDTCFPPSVVRASITAIRDGRVHVSTEPDPAISFDERWVFPDDGTHMEFLSSVAQDLSDEETFYAPPRYRDPVTNEFPPRTPGQQKLAELLARVDAYRAAA